ETWTTGYFSFPAIELPGPSGCFQSAPKTGFHQSSNRRVEVSVVGGVKTAENGLSFSFSTLGNCSAVGVRSATVTYPVALTNSANCSLVTSVASIQKPWIVTGWIGSASPRNSAASEPILKVPPG